jgi:hypothetical protein
MKRKRKCKLCKNPGGVWSMIINGQSFLVCKQCKRTSGGAAGTGKNGRATIKGYHGPNYSLETWDQMLNSSRRMRGY